MKIGQKLFFWAMLLAGMTGLFYLAGAPVAEASADERTPVTLLTAEGPVKLTMAQYLPHAVAAEMPVGFGPEALKAQAVAARSYVLAGPRHDNADVCASGCCIAWLDEQSLRQRWGGDYEKNWRAVLDAVTATDGEYLAYGGQAIQAAFHASSAGMTEDSGSLWSPLPYLVSVESPETEQNVPVLITTVEISAEELAEKLSVESAGEPSGWVEDTALDDSGRVETLTVCGERFSGGTVRSLFGLRSTDFDLAWDGDRFVFTVSGYGHGVGMSQYGAMLYAAQGWSYRDILAHYYPGAEPAVYVP